MNTEDEELYVTTLTFFTFCKFVLFSSEIFRACETFVSLHVGGNNGGLNELWKTAMDGCRILPALLLMC